jgi:hypothetical protein
MKMAHRRWQTAIADGLLSLRLAGSTESVIGTTKDRDHWDRDQNMPGPLGVRINTPSLVTDSGVTINGENSM